MNDHFKDLYHLATEEERQNGLTWYQEARGFAEGLAAKYDQPLERVIGIIASLSPRCPWSVNCRQAKEFIRTKGNTTVTTYRTNKKKAKAILKGRDPIEALTPVRPDRTTKTISFYHNILSPETSEEVTIDSLMIRAYYNDPNYDVKRAFNNGSIMKELSNRIKAIASEEGLKPHQVQAMLWQAWKRITDTKPYTNVVNYESLLQG